MPRPLCRRTGVKHLGLSMNSLSPSDGQPTKPAMTRADVESYLKRAPVAIGEGPNGVKRAAAKIARKIGPFVKSNADGWTEPFHVFETHKLMCKYWLAR